jgi:DNA-binding response OmpR family regulator
VGAADAERLPGSVLVVDDEEAIREVVSARLRFVCSEVRTAQGGLEAWKLIEQGPPDVLVTDLMMPDFTGEELTRRVRESGYRKSIWILMLTARRGVKKRVEGFEAGADDYLEKPFDLEELAARVRTGLRVRALQREVEEMTRYEAIGWVAYAFGHEIRNPLAVILSNAALQKEHGQACADLWHAAGRAAARLEALGASEEARALREAGVRFGGIPAAIAEALEVADANARLARRAAAAVAALQRFSEGASGSVRRCDPQLLVEDAVRLAFAGRPVMPEIQRPEGDLPDVSCVPRDVVLALATALGRAAPRPDHLPRIEVRALARGVVLRVEGPGDGTPPQDLLVPRIADRAPGETRSGLDLGLSHALVALRAAGAGLSVGPREDGGLIVEVLLPVFREP